MMKKKIKDVMLQILLTGLRLTRFVFACLMLRLVSWDVRYDEKKNIDVMLQIYKFYLRALMVPPSLVLLLSVLALAQLFDSFVYFLSIHCNHSGYRRFYYSIFCSPLPVPDIVCHVYEYFQCQVYGYF